MRKPQIIIGILLGAVLLVLGACAPAEEEVVVTEEEEVAPAPAEFEVVSLDIEPLEVVAGETVSVTAVVKNVGGSEGTYAVILTVDEVTVETKEVAIAPGASQTVTFSLVKDAAGTYEIGVGELSSSLVVKEQLVVKEFELKYDDGTSEGFQAIGSSPGTGYIVHFSPPATPFTINEVRIYGKVYRTGYEELTFQIEVWDENFNILHSHQEPHTKFSLEPSWVAVDIPGITVDGDFYIHVWTSSPPEGGVTVGYDSSIKNEHSDMTRDYQIVWWGSRAKETVNWMIRVVGTPAEKGTPVTSPATPPSPQTIEVSAEFRETLSSLDTPQKLSQWMINNIQIISRYEQYKETGINYRAPPDETFETRLGCCADFAIFACYVLEHHGYEAEMLSIAVESDPSKGHAVCVYQFSGSLYTINVGRIEGPFQTYEDIAFAHHKDWSQYSVYYSWDNFQKLGYPDKVVHRE